MRCTKISAEFKFGGHSPRGPHPAKMWRWATTLGESAQAVYSMQVNVHKYFAVIVANVVLCVTAEMRMSAHRKTRSLDRMLTHAAVFFTLLSVTSRAQIQNQGTCALIYINYLRRITLTFCFCLSNAVECVCLS